MEMICYSRHCVEKIMNLVFNSTKVKWFALYHTNLSHKVKFCVIEVFKFWVRCRYEENKEWQYPKLGDSQGTPRKYSRNMQATKLGDAPEGIPSFVSNIIGNLTWSYVFIGHMICVLLGASVYFVRICLMLFGTMFCIFYFNKTGIDSLYYAYVRSPHIAVWKQKVYRCCNNSLEKSECDKCWNLLHIKLW